MSKSGKERGVVFRSTGSWYDVKTQSDETFKCNLKGKIRLQGLRSTNPIAVGDKVVFERSDNGQGSIEKIEERKNFIARKSVNLSKESHIVASNLDRAFLIVTIASPRTSSGFIDRFLVTAEAYGIPTTIVFNKVDLLVEDEEASRRQKELERVYSCAGYEILKVSAETGKGIDELRLSLNKGINLLSGHSGVGKSTIINKIVPGLDLKTAGVSDYHSKGRHTTTFAEMFEVPGGGFIIDTPGIKGFGLTTLEKETLNHHFPEIFNKLEGCKFNNCVHVGEPGCAVKKAVETGDVSEERYRNYLEMYDTFEEGPYR
ncbi:MAG: ribosome small subunit-dependent GTPase A [Crocinitomicaceae bacterium]|nr:ribosome small subunit-dependent GTPase A [Crocinitomicaceae bacterium]